MSYIRHDKDNNPVSPQPSANSVTLYSGTEGWTEITYDVWTGDYIARDSDNNIKIRETYQKHDKDNNPISPGSYQRHDKDNNPILL